MKKMTEFFIRNKKYIIYFFVGVLTTIINYTVYFLLYNIYNYAAVVSNVAAWVVAIVFSFFGNKFFVFTSHRCSQKVLASDILNLNGLIWKIFSSIFVIIFNYISSDFFVFRNKA